MKKILVPVAVLVAGSGVGAGAAIGAHRLLGSAPPPIARIEPASVFVPVPKVLVPLVLPDDRLAGYVVFDAELQVPEDTAAAVTERLPLLLHAINMRAYRTPLAAGRDGLLPDVARLKRLVAAAVPEAFGKHVVRGIAITRAEPA